MDDEDGSEGYVRPICDSVAQVGRAVARRARQDDPREQAEMRSELMSAGSVVTREGRQILDDWNSGRRWGLDD